MRPRSITLLLLLFAVGLGLTSSCQGDRYARPPNLYPHITLPEANILDHHDRGMVVRAGIRKNGAIYIAGRAYSLERFESLVQAVIKRVGIDQYVFDIGADVATPFARIWPALKVCRANGIEFIGFVTTRTSYGSYYPVFVGLPRPEGHPEEQRPLVVMNHENAVTIGIKTNGFTLNGVPHDAPALQSALERMKASDEEKPTLILVPEQGLLHRDFMKVVVMCHKIGLRNLDLMEAPADADFKRHAPIQTVGEGAVRDGERAAPDGTPESRRTDVDVVGGTPWKDD